MTDELHPDANLFPLSKAPAEVERMHGVRPHRSVVYRWVKRGYRGVHLEFRSIGGRMHTSRAWLEAFFAATTRLRAPHQTSSTPARSRMTEEQAERYLTSKGILTK